MTWTLSDRTLIELQRALVAAHEQAHDNPIRRRQIDRLGRRLLAAWKALGVTAQVLGIHLDEDGRRWRSPSDDYDSPEAWARHRTASAEVLRCWHEAEQFLDNPGAA